MANILVIDDDPAFCNILSEALCRLGHEVTVAHDGEQGIELIEKHGLFSMVFTDICMPLKDGNSVARYMRSSAKLKDIPLVAITGFLDDVDRDLFSITLGKPFKVRELINVISFFSKEED